MSQNSSKYSKQVVSAVFLSLFYAFSSQKYFALSRNRWSSYTKSLALLSKMEVWDTCLE